MTATIPADIVNRALDAIGAEHTIGDLQEGTREAGAALRVYGPLMRQLLRAAHWNFARKEARLTLLQDATGQTPNVGTGTPGMGQWRYEYQWPIDGLQARFVPAAIPSGINATVPGNHSLPATPLTPGITAQPWLRRPPTPFVVTQDNVPPVIGAMPSWSAVPDLGEGQGYGQQTVILSNQQNATLVYTALITYPDEWDSLFQQAFVAVLASYLAMPCLADKKFALQVRGQQVMLAKAALDEARRVDGDEGWFTINREAAWMRARSTAGGMWRGDWSGGDGMLGCGWAGFGMVDGSVY